MDMLWKFGTGVVEEVQEDNGVNVAAGSYNGVDQGGAELIGEIRGGDDVAPVGGVGEEGGDLVRQVICGW